jgi:hypothetical protein
MEKIKSHCLSITEEHQAGNWCSTQSAGPFSYMCWLPGRIERPEPRPPKSQIYIFSTHSPEHEMLGGGLKALKSTPQKLHPCSVCCQEGLKA